MLQLEVPVATSIATARRAHNAVLFVVLDPAPAASLPVDTYPLFDCLTPNATEAAAMVGSPSTARMPPSRRRGRWWTRAHAPRW
jgi:sugar/nucleoside kinase (ribokinase family)